MAGRASADVYPSSPLISKHLLHARRTETLPCMCELFILSRRMSLYGAIYLFFDKYVIMAPSLVNDEGISAPTECTEVKPAE